MFLGEQLSSGFNDDVKANILAYSGFGLRALGRLREATEPMREQLKARIQLKDWRNAATAAGSLSELFLTLGQVTTIYN